MKPLQSKLEGFESIGIVDKRTLPIDAIYTYSTKFSCCIAVKAGWKFGINSDRGHDCSCVDRWEPHKVVFVDNNFKNYNHKKHVDMVMRYHPKYCTVRDIISKEKCKMMGIEYYSPEAILDFAEELSSYSDNVIVIPKEIEYIDKIPSKFMLGYSVPTGYGGAEFSIDNFTGRRVHLLGGRWKNQLRLIETFGDGIVSFDNNHISRISQYGKYIDFSGNDQNLIKDLFPQANNPYYICMAISLGNIASKINELYN